MIGWTETWSGRAFGGGIVVCWGGYSSASTALDYTSRRHERHASGHIDTR